MLILDRAQRLGVFLPFPMCTSEFDENVQLSLAPQMQKAGATYGWYCLHWVPRGMISLWT